MIFTSRFVLGTIGYNEDFRRFQEQQRKWDLRFLGMAEFDSTWSLDPSTKVGAVISDPLNRIISLGYNGFPAGMPDDPEKYADREEKYRRIIHGEMNAILFAGGHVLTECTLYTWPVLPCERCFVHVLQAGIRRIVASKASEDLEARWNLDRTRQLGRESEVEIVEL